ncbi:cell division protein ZapE [Bosea sp. (in: a-proteobacteria)]|uniref:cell division protein ZapE n=1 Tax=Bosea sp. (in: a-proteobacteria) TaxID=1871050 RepID=UPI00260D1033|nr:cell division protein ZapE [Bosea sp. (in: a-proteobacteria)]MCO5091441.1 cell division protein ZapE [Bosea sp. (in: a-proteobacteria)]
MSASITDRYAALVEAGAIERDPAQVAVVKKLEALTATLAARRLARKGSALGWLFGRRPETSEAPKGLYVWGSVGRGKTMLMDMFFEAAPVKRKRRVHFHEFLADVHARINAYRQKIRTGEVKDADPIAPVAADLAGEAYLLCFDEFTVTDIADAMILGRLFTALFSAGVVVVATSNVEPSRLYEGGLNRALFTPFIALLQTRVEVLKLDARTDFRLEKLGGAPVYHVPADAKAKAALDQAFKALSGVERGQRTVLSVQGHDLVVPQAAGGVARASFADLCAEAYGASDYIALAQRFHTLVLDDIPVLDYDRRNEAKRFIILIDTLYEHHVKLVASAAAEPHELYKARQGREAFEFDRTVSRLIEMRSGDYLSLPHGRPDSAASGDTTGLVET